MTDDTNKVINFSVRSSLGRGPQKGYLLLIGPSLEGMPEKMPELLILKQACLNYCFRACLAYLFPGTLQARFQARFQAFNPFRTAVPF